MPGNPPPQTPPPKGGGVSHRAHGKNLRITFQKFFGVLIFLIAFAGTAWAEDAPVIQARAGVHPDFDRIVFDWPQKVDYHVERDGDRVTVSFGARAQPHFTGFSYLTRARDFSPGTDSAGNLTVSFTVDSKTALKDFLSDHSVVIDIETASSAPPKVAKKEPVEPAHAETPPPAPPPAPAPATAPTPAVTPAPAAAPTPPVEAAAAPTPLPAPAPAPVAPPVADNTPAPAPATAPVITPALRTAVDLPEVTDTPLLVAALDPRTAIRAVIWQRGGYGMIVFDRKITLSVDALTTGQQAPRVSLEALDLPKASGFRFPVPPNAELHATRTGTVWKIFLVKQLPEVPVTTTLVAQPDFALGARFLLPLPDAPEPVHMTDPIAGDDLILVPLEQTEAFSVARRMADFEILPAAQGLVIKPLTDKIIVRAVTDGIEITAEGGLHLSSALDTGASQQSTQKARAAAAGKSMFDFAGLARQAGRNLHRNAPAPAANDRRRAGSRTQPRAAGAGAFLFRPR